MTYSEHPAYDIRAYILDRLYSEMLDESDYGSLEPLFPENDTPETANVLKKLPYIVYSVSSPSVINTQHWLMAIDVTFTVKSDNFDEAMRLQMFLFDLLKRFEYTAREINEFSDSNMFLTVFVSDVYEVQEPTNEYGKYSASLAIEAQYTRAINSSQRFAL